MSKSTMDTLIRKISSDTRGIIQPYIQQGEMRGNQPYVSHLFEVASASHVSTIVTVLVVQSVLLPRILSRWCGCTTTVKVESTRLAEERGALLPPSTQLLPMACRMAHQSALPKHRREPNQPEPNLVLLNAMTRLGSFP
jgi:hypothetical protein